jgi:hypothetical protein
VERAEGREAGDAQTEHALEVASAAAGGEPDAERREEAGGESDLGVHGAWYRSVYRIHKPGAASSEGSEPVK